MPSYDRFWELHVTGVTGFYDFAPSILDQRTYQLATHGATLTAKRTLVRPKAHVAPGVINRHPIGVKGLPAQGYVATCATVAELAAGVVNAEDQAVVAWINDPAHIGKLRINAHGDGMGNIGMANGGRPLPVLYIEANEVVSWMRANGLAKIVTGTTGSRAGTKNTNGLITINIAVCMGARHGTTPAELNYWQTNSTPAPNSAAARVAKALTDAGMTGIEVTASNEITMDGASGRAGQWGRTFGLGGGQAPFLVDSRGESHAWDMVKANGGVTIRVPHGWNVSEDFFGPSGTISPPPAFTDWTASGVTPSAGWVIRSTTESIEIPAGWMVNQAKRAVHPPLGFTVKSGGKNKGGTLTSLVEPNAPFTGMGQRMAHSACKARVIS